MDAKIRKLAIEDIPRKDHMVSLAHTMSLASSSSDEVFTELPAPVAKHLTSDKAAVIHVGDITIDVSETISPEFLRSILKVVRSC